MGARHAEAALGRLRLSEGRRDALTCCLHSWSWEPPNARGTPLPHVFQPAHALHNSPTPRSDSNGEDLEGYAGAGLYESITMDATETVRVDYSDDPITADAGFRKKVGCSRVSKLALAARFGCVSAW